MVVTAPIWEPILIKRYISITGTKIIANNIEFICPQSKLLVEINQHSNYYNLMSYSFEYIDIILLAMIAGFIFLRLRGILGKRTGFEGKATSQLKEVLKTVNQDQLKRIKENFDEEAQKEFIKGAKIAYETVITDFSDNDNKITTSKPLLNNEIFNKFNQALKERSSRGHYAEITFIGVNSAKIKEHKKIGKILNVTVDFIAEVITCIRDKDKKIVSGDPEKIKKIYDTWVFSRDITSSNPNWQLVNILT